MNRSLFSTKAATFLQKSSLLIAIFLHILLFLAISIRWGWPVFPDEKPDRYIESYAYEEKKASIQENKTFAQKTPEPNKPISPHGIEKPIFNSHEVVRFNQAVTVASSPSDPVHLVGDNKKIPKPLIILLGKAMTAKLAYPRAAMDLRVKGIAVIGFVLHPNGQVSDVQLLKSSKADILDQAALSAARDISPVKKAGAYVTAPEPIVFGIIFGGRE